MIVHIPEVLSAAEVARFRERLDGAEWADGKATAGYQSALAKRNLQLPERGEAAAALNEALGQALARSLLFQAAALPDAIYPAMFSRYETGHDFGAHVDNAWRPLPAGGRIRTDLSATLFLADPDSYDGGELVIEDMAGDRAIKLAGGRFDPLSLDQPAPRFAGDSRRAAGGGVLGPEPRRPRRAARAAPRPRPRHPVAPSQGGRRGPGSGRADRRLSQSAAALVELGPDARLR